MSITPLCNATAALTLSSTRHHNHKRQMLQRHKPTRAREYSSPDVFASALRPMCPDWSQGLWIRVRRCPARSACDAASLRVRPFRYAPKGRKLGPVMFKDVPNGGIVKRRRSAAKEGRAVKRPSIPFDEEEDLDPWLLFPDLQRPYSAFRDDLLRYRCEAEEAERERRQRLCVRGSPLTAEELKELVSVTYEYANTPERMVTTPESISKRSYSPMDID